jgi:hypothetical protein
MRPMFGKRPELWFDRIRARWTQFEKNLAEYCRLSVPKSRKLRQS